MTPTEERAAAAIKDVDEAREKAEADDASGADAALKGLARALSYKR